MLRKISAALAALAALAGCGEQADGIRIAFLHHSTGRAVWEGGVRERLRELGKRTGRSYVAEEIAFPKESPYGWNNYPYDYWNIWVNHGGARPYMEEPTLEILAADYDIVAFKHCFPVSAVLPDTGKPDISSPEKRAENYRAQYEALKEKMREFPDTGFIVWTGAALVEEATTGEQARRAREFFEWVRDEWDEEGDNIYVFDFFELETEGGLYLKREYARSAGNSHPSKEFARKAARAFAGRIDEVASAMTASGAGETDTIR